MTQRRLFEAASGILTRDAFNFMADHQLRYAQRTQEFATLVVITAERESRELVAADEWIMRELGRVIRCVVRDTDLVGRASEGTLSLLLAGIDIGRAPAVIERLHEHLGRYRAPLQITVGSACCPTHASCSEELFRQAMSSRTPRSETR